MYPLNLPPLQILHLSSQLLWAGLSLTLIGPSLLKIGYVLRLVAQQRLKDEACPHAIA